MASTAVYIRVSSKCQDTASQEPDVRRYLAAHGLEDAPVYRDKFTGRTMDRPGFQKLLAAIRAGEVKSVIVWRLDRLGRTAKGLSDLFAELNTRKVNLVSLRDGLDLSTPAGRLMGHVLASVAEYETEIRAERILAGLEIAREKGVRFGRPEGPGKAIKVTPEQVRQVKRLKAEGLGVVAISKAVGLSRPTIYRLLAVHSRAGRLLPVALLSGAHAPLPRPDSLATRDRGGPHARPRAVPAAAHRREARHALPRYARAADRLAGPRPPRHAVARRDPQGRLRAEALTTPGHRA